LGVTLRPEPPSQGDVSGRVWNEFEAEGLGSVHKFGNGHKKDWSSQSILA